jgi:hypothetical protein
VLDPWQQYVVRESLGRRDGKWAAFEVCLIVARQNGKGAVLEALELAALFLFEPVKLILHSAHEFKTCSEHFRRMLALIQSSPDFDREVARVRTQTGAEAIELKDGTRLRFVARSSGSGRGFTGDLIVMDEDQKVTDEPRAALADAERAKDPQVVYAASAGNEGSTQPGRIRARGWPGTTRRWRSSSGPQRTMTTRVTRGRGRRRTRRWVSASTRTTWPGAFGAVGGGVRG